MTQYNRLSFSEREELSRCLSLKMPLRGIARELGRSPSTICREIRRHGPTAYAYRAVSAQRCAARAAKVPRRGRKLDMNERLQVEVVRLLWLRWSPEQIAKRLPILYPDDETMRISHEAIYSPTCTCIHVAA